MTYYYMDFVTGSDAASGVDWANEVKTFEILFSKMSAGDIGVIRQGSDDTVAGLRTFTSPGTIANPCKLIGVAAGTTNTGTSIVASDLASTLPVITNSGAGADLIFNGSLTLLNVHIITVDRINFGALASWAFISSKLTYGGRFFLTAGTKISFTASILAPTAGAAEIIPNGGYLEMLGGSIEPTTQPNQLFRSGAGSLVNFIGVDVSTLTAEITLGGAAGIADIKFINCITNATVTPFSSAPASAVGSVELIASDNSSSVGNTSSIQDYSYEDSFGTVDLETTVVRTGGADDGAAGLFAYAMTVRSNATMESTAHAIVSPWLSVWVPGGVSKTLTVYIANSTASDDYNEDEVWCEFYTPDAGDTAQHDQTFDPAEERLLDSAVAVTDDTGSTWGTGGNNHQKFSVTTTPGFEGYAYARVHLAKRQATPDTLYLDPNIEIS